VLGRNSHTTTTGQIIEADIWFRAHGVHLNTGYLTDGKLIDLNDRGEVSVNENLTVGPHRNIYAIGDITDIAEAKMAGYAGQHATVVTQNIRAQINGEEPSNAYHPLGYPMILLPLGTRYGVGQLPSKNGPALVPPEVVSEYKGKDIFTSRFKQQFGPTL
jgi:NADH dehydrogenase FAD-containing subunit